MAVTAVNDNGNAAQAARNVRVQPPAPPEEKNDRKAEQAVAGEEHNKVTVEADKNAAVVIERLTPVDVVERQKAPDIDPIPRQVNVPNPFEDAGQGNAAPEGASPASAAPPEAQGNAPAAQAVNNEGPPRAEVQGPEPVPNEGEVAPPQEDVAAPAAEPPAEEPAAIVEPPAPQPEPNEAAKKIQLEQAEGQANNNPIAEQEIGGTVNIAV